MRVLIHAVPSRMWYVNDFLVPSLRAQGIDPDIYVDTQRLGNLGACLDSFSKCSGDATWHLQDDVLICRDFAERASKITGVANGFCHLRSGDLLECAGWVYPPDFWNGFPCVRIPDDYAREFVEWIRTDASRDSWCDIHIQRGCADDFLFKRFLEDRHFDEMVYNVSPSLAEHVDWLIGGSMVNEWRGYICRSDDWHDEELVKELRQKLKNR